MLHCTVNEFGDRLKIKANKHLSSVASMLVFNGRFSMNDKTGIYQKLQHASGGIRTLDHWFKRPALLPLSYGGS